MPLFGNAIVAGPESGSYAYVYFAHPALSMDVHSDRGAHVLSEGDVDLFRGDIGRFFSGLMVEL